MGGIVVGTVRLWHIQAGSVKDALVLGPLAVSADVQSQGVGSRLMRAALNRASLAAYSAVLLVGDAPYYSRFGFSASLTDGLWMPGPVERERFLALELKAGSLSHAFGLVKATGEWSVVDTSSHEFNIAGNGLRNAA
jgi:predicted N-acetyltransferase YhbS